MNVIMWEGSLIDHLVEHDDYTIKVGIKNGTLAFIDKWLEVNQYKLLQFHIHSPSEHTFNGKGYDAELHLVH